jgi:D-beta-D-heptose 7-phosphate kinase/D-beta-D-heptose 1-phosphate adenosyltransferase
MMDRTRARELVSRFGRQKILVLGDLMLDRFIRGSAERLSPEAPVPVVLVTQESDMPGGAANVAMNVRSLGGDAVVAGIAGRDKTGDDLIRVLDQAGISTQGVIRVKGITTTEKTRILAERQQVVRVDREHNMKFDADVLASFSAKVARAMRGCTGAVIEDYGKGAVKQPAIDAVLRAAHRMKVPVGYDPKDDRSIRLRGITMATPNCKEAHVCAGLAPRSHVGAPLKDRILREAAKRLMAKWRPEALVVTLGSQGMYLVTPGQAPVQIPTRAREVFDVSGAGDTVIATCLLALAAGATMHEAAVLGNYAAGVVVGKLGTATCTPGELLENLDRDQAGGA